MAKHRRQRVAVSIAEQQLDELASVPQHELTNLLGRPVQVLIMGPDRRPYLITVLVLRHLDRALRIHVTVDTGGWGDDSAVVRTLLLPPPRTQPAY